MENVAMERRFHVRHRARTDVHIRVGGKKKMCRAVNLSANGVAVETTDMGLTKGQQVELSFAINLGPVSKIHRRKAIVVHVRNGVTGFMMEQYTGK